MTCIAFKADAAVQRIRKVLYGAASVIILIATRILARSRCCRAAILDACHVVDEVRDERP